MKNFGVASVLLFNLTSFLATCFALISVAVLYAAPLSLSPMSLIGILNFGKMEGCWSPLVRVPWDDGVMTEPDWLDPQSPGLLFFWAKFEFDIEELNCVCLANIYKKKGLSWHIFDTVSIWYLNLVFKLCIDCDLVLNAILKMCANWLLSIGWLQHQRNPIKMSLDLISQRIPLLNKWGINLTRYN